MLFNISQRYVFNSEQNLLIDNLNDSAEIKLNRNENKILLLLSQHPNKLISRKELQEHVWIRDGIVVHDSSVTQAISTLRRALGDSTKAPEYIMTVPKRGYQLIANVEEITPPAEMEIEEISHHQKRSRFKNMFGLEFPSFQNLFSRMAFTASLCICLYVMVH
ncbi:transcriptional regulator [Vibrio sp. HN007]|uniref:winged helix-turn-helix domain-containing protein n=1 Tax=Vibrio iocasae TaxID=3098914 RepID=UPI0035D45C5E